MKSTTNEIEDVLSKYCKGRKLHYVSELGKRYLRFSMVKGFLAGCSLLLSLVASLLFYTLHALSLLIFFWLLIPVSHLDAVPYQGQPNYRLNSGGGAFTDSQGNLWSADAAYNGGAGGNGFGYVITGNTSNTGNDIIGTTDDPLYQTSRWGQRLEYRFDLPHPTNGANAGTNYTVRLKFAETYWTSAGARKFRVYLNDIDVNNRGYRVLDNADIFSLAGGKDRAWDFVISSFPVNEGTLKITLYSDYAGAADNACISAIQINQVPYTIGDIGMSDDALLDKIEYADVKWFIDNVDGPYYLASGWGGAADEPGWGKKEDTNIAGVGPQIALYCAAVKRGWMTYTDAFTRVKGILQGIDLMRRTPDYALGGPPCNQPSMIWSHGENFRAHEVYRMNPSQDHCMGPEHDIFDNNGLWMGVLFAMEYFKGTEIEAMARRLYEETGWNQFDLRYAWYSEVIHAFFLMAGHPDPAKRASYPLWDTFGTLQRGDMGGMYFYTWAWNWIDPRYKTDHLGRNHLDWGARFGINNHRNNWIAAWQSDPGEYNTYDWDSWGGDFGGFADGARYLTPYGDSLYSKDAGSISPNGLLFALPFDDKSNNNVLNAVKHIYWRYYKLGWPEGMNPIWHEGKYGFGNAYNIGTTWNGTMRWSHHVNSNYDFGNAGLGVENYRTGFVWHYMMQNEIIKNALNRLGWSNSPAPETDLAEGKATVTSSNVGSNDGYKAVDNKMYTRWESNPSDPQWIHVDLGSIQNIGTVELWWEAAYASSYQIQVSNDATNWTTVKTVTGGDGGVDRHIFAPTVSGRYVRMYGTQRGTTYGYSLWAMRVFNKPQVTERGVVDDFEAACSNSNRVVGIMGSFTSNGGTISHDCESGSGKVYSGARARWISFNVNGANQTAGWFTSLDHYDARLFNYITFQVKGFTGGEKFDVGLKDYQGNEVKKPIGPYLAAGVSASQFRQVVIPLSHFTGVNAADLDNVTITFSNAQGSPANSTIYVDDLKFTETANTSLSVPAPVVNSIPAWSTTQNQTLTITGNAGSNITVVPYVEISGVGQWEQANVTANSNGNFTATAGINGTDGTTFLIYAHAKDAFNNWSGSSNVQSIRKDLYAPTVVITSPANGASVESPANVTYTATDNIDTNLSVTVTPPGPYVTPGAYTVTVTAQDDAGWAGNATVNFTVTPANLALNKTVTASSQESATYSANKVVDGNMATRWASTWSDPQWIKVDFGTPQTFNKVVLEWESAYGKAYKIETSTNNVYWNEVYCTTTENGGKDVIFFAPITARYVRMYGTVRGTTYGYSLWEFKVYNDVPASNPNLALSKPATASSQESSSYTPAKAVDGSASTRWSSLFSDPQWIRVDLGSSKSFNRVSLDWEVAYGKTYKVQTSPDGTTWTDVCSYTNGNGGVDVIGFPKRTARYVRMYGTLRGTVWGYSIQEFEVYNDPVQ